MTSPDPLRLLFVCVENACRSQMAQGFAQAVPGVLAMSAGSAPSGRVNPRAVRCMEVRGVPLREPVSKSVDDLPAHDWDVVVTMGCGDRCPSLPARRRLDWDLPDPAPLDDQGFGQVCDEIGRRVRALIAQELRS